MLSDRKTNKTKVRRLFQACVVTFLLMSGIGAFAAGAEIRIGVLESKDPGFYVNTFGPTMFALRKLNPQKTFKTQQYSLDELQEAIKQKKVDFFIAPSGFFSFLEQTIGAKQIAARNEKYADDPNKSVGSVYITHADRKELASIQDLKGLRVASSNRDSLENWISAMGEIKKQGHNPDKFFKDAVFTDHDFPDVITLVLNKAVDVGILGACELENFFEGNTSASPALKVIAAKPLEGLRCLHSSDLYPDMIFASIPSTRSNLVHKMTLDLLSMKSQDGSHLWSVANDFNSIKRLYSDLNLPPYEESRLTFSRLWTGYRNTILVGLLLLFLLLVHVIRVNFLVAKRTLELNESNKSKEEFERKANRAVQNLAQMEKLSIVTQMSSVIAHEIHQPLHSLLNYSGGLVLYCQKNNIEDPVLLKTLKEIDRETQRVSEIVEHVRAYAKNKTSRTITISTTEIVRAAIESFSRSTLGSKVEVKVLHLDECTLKCDPLEIELVLLNLMKNSSQAVEHWPNKQIELAGRELDEHYVFTVRDFGPIIDEETRKRFCTFRDNSKKNGLGLGLALCRSIAERHYGSLAFEFPEEGGLMVSVSIRQNLGEERNAKSES